MESIYTNQEMCAELGVPYFDDVASFAVSASRLLKLGGYRYDKEHVTFLRSFGDNTIILTRDNTEGRAAPRDLEYLGPGWWRVRGEKS